MTSLLCGWVKLSRDHSTLAATLLWFCLGRLKRAQTWRRAGGPKYGTEPAKHLWSSSRVSATRRPIHPELMPQTSTIPKSQRSGTDNRSLGRLSQNGGAPLAKRCCTSAAAEETAGCLILLAGLSAAQVHRIQMQRSFL